MEYKGYNIKGELRTFKYFNLDEKGKFKDYIGEDESSATDSDTKYIVEEKDEDGSWSYCADFEDFESAKEYIDTKNKK